MQLECKRCGYEWIRKFDKMPKVCPSCKSPYWQKPLTEYWRKIRENNKQKN